MEQAGPFGIYRMTIGIPRAGLYYLYYPFWKTFLETLGFDVVVSAPTNRNLLAAGLKVANSELCLPMKVMYGHILDLRGRVDFVLLPQMDECSWGAGTYGTSTYFCPYFVGMPDVMEAEFPDLKILRPVMSFHDNQIVDGPWLDFGRQLGKNREVVRHAFDQALASYQLFLAERTKNNRTPLEILEKKKVNTGDLPQKMALVGRPYIVYDESANLELIKKINQRGYRVQTLEMIDPEELRLNFRQLPFHSQSHWYLTNEEYGALRHFGQRPDIAGIIYLIPFNCGPDFMVEETVIADLRRRKPVAIISIDESTGEAGLTTRLDAFIDMLK